jgi:ComF family protein
LPYLETQCAHCAEPLICDGICPKCQKKPPEFRRCIALFNYRQPINLSITKIKRDPHSPELKQLSYLLADLLLVNYKDIAMPTILIPMPLHHLKLMHRGFNQSHAIASLIKHRLPNTDLRNDICVRNHYGKPQHLQTKKQRWKSISGAFSARSDHSIQGRRLALIDDVVTTGATATAATQSLLNAGAKSVDIWCIARTGWHNRAGSIKI